MTKQDQTLAEEFAWAFSRIYMRCKSPSPYDAKTGEAVSHRQAAVLDALCDIHPKYVGDVAARLGVTSATLSLTLDRMAREGWIERLRDAADRRKVQVRLTDRGARLQKNSEILDPSHVLGVLAALTPIDRARLVGALRRVAQAADEPSLSNEIVGATKSF